MPLLNFLRNNSIFYKENVSLSFLTGMNIEGILPLIVYPSNIDQLVLIYKEVLREEKSYEIVGGLTNTYLCENFTRDIVIVTTHVKDLLEYENKLIVGCGYGLSLLAKRLTTNGFSHYSGLVGIPGTIGAAAINNSGAFGDSISQVVEKITIVDTNGVIRDLSLNDLSYSPRKSVLKGVNFGVLLSVVLRKDRYDDPDILLDNMKRNQKYRHDNIDGKRKSLGSIFTGVSIKNIWEHHKIANCLKKIICFPFSRTKLRKKVQCFAEFFVLGNVSFIKHCDDIGRFCWSSYTTEDIFMNYLRFVSEKSNNSVVLEIEIKK